MTNPVISWAKDNPVAAGAAALGVIVVVMMVTGGSSEETDGASGGLGSAGVAAYYEAVSRQGQAGAAIQIAQINANADTNKALIAANYGIENAKVWAPIQSQQIASDAANTSKALDYEHDVSIQTLQHEHAMYDNYINLQNSALAQQQNIAFKQANVQNKANKRGFIGGIIGTVANVGLAVATGGTSLLGSGAIKAATGATGVKLPTLGSSGQWV